MSEIIPKSSLEKWAIKKYHQHCSTMELMAEAKNQHELTAIAIVALLEVDPAIRYRGMSENEANYLKSCHHFLRTLVSDPGAARGATAR